MKKIKNALLLSALIAMFGYTLAFSREASDEAYRALLFCGKVLVPQLFTGTVLAKMLISFPDVLNVLSRFGERGCGLTVLISGLVCGAQTGAVVLNGMYENGCISRDYACKALAFCGGASAPFLIGYVGVQMKGSFMYGIKLVMLQAAMSLLFFAFSGGKPGNAAAYSPQSISCGGAVSQSVMICLDMCGFVVFFSSIASAVKRILPQPIAGFVHASLEFSSGITSAVNDAQIGWAIGFGGICVLLQLISVSGDLRHGRLFASKVIYGFVFAVLTNFLR